MAPPTSAVPCACERRCRYDYRSKYFRIALAPYGCGGGTPGTKPGGWPADLADEGILEQLLALNAARAAAVSPPKMA
jgi:hypothetical protein